MLGDYRDAFPHVCDEECVLEAGVHASYYFNCFLCNTKLVYLPVDSSRGYLRFLVVEFEPSPEKHLQDHTLARCEIIQACL